MWSNTRAGAAGLALAVMMNWCIAPLGASAFSGSPLAFAGGMSTGALLTLRSAPGPRSMCARRARVGMQPDSSGAEAYHARHWKDFQSSSAAVAPAASVAPVAKKEAPTPTPKATAPALKANAPADAKKESAEPAKSTEPNAFAMMALKAGFLKQSSPLIMSPMAGNKGFDPAGFAKVCVCLLCFRFPHVDANCTVMLYV